MAGSLAQGRKLDPLAKAGGEAWTPNSGEFRGTDRVFHLKNWSRLPDRAKVATLRRFAEEYGADPQMRWFTAKVLENSGAAPRDFRAQAAALLKFVQTQIYYTNEDGEQLQSPWRTLRERNGDCDDVSSLLASMLQSIAFPWRLALGGYRQVGNRKIRVRWVEGQPWPRGHVHFVHIYVMIGRAPFDPSGWMSAEPTVRGLPLGHDVVLHGIPSGAGGGKDLAGWHGASYGATELFDGKGADYKVIEGNGVLANTINAIDYSGLLNSVVQGVITAVAIGYVGSRIGKKGGM